MDGTTNSWVVTKGVQYRLLLTVLKAGERVELVRRNDDSLAILHDNVLIGTWAAAEERVCFEKLAELIGDLRFLELALRFRLSSPKTVSDLTPLQ